MKKLVGIVSPAKMFEDNNTNNDRYNFGNNYGKRIYAAGGIPVGILPCDGRVSEETLAQFDSFLICGGTQSWPYQLQVAQYAIRNDKPLLGICLGMQTIHRTFKLLDYMEETGYTGDIYDLFAKVREEDWIRLRPVSGHIFEEQFQRDDASPMKHRVNILPGSHIHRIFGTDHIYGASSHKYCAVDPSPRLTVSGRTEDGTVEIIEYGDKVLGVQFHPEVDDKLHALFSFLCE